MFSSVNPGILSPLGEVWDLVHLYIQIYKYKNTFVKVCTYSPDDIKPENPKDQTLKGVRALEP